MAGSPIKRARKEAARRKQVSDNAAPGAGTDYSSTLKWFKSHHGSEEWDALDILTAARMEIHLLGTSRDAAPQRLTFLKVALDARRQIFAERQAGEGVQHKLLVEVIQGGDAPLSELLAAPESDSTDTAPASTEPDGTP